MTVEVNAIKTVVELPRLAQSEEPGGTGGEARGRGGLGAHVSRARSVAVLERPIIGVRRIVTIALTEGAHWTLLDAELHHGTIRTEGFGTLAGTVVVRSSRLLVRITE